METGSRAGGLPAAASEDNGVLTIDDEFESIFDVPFMTMNKVNGQYQAEVIMSLDDSRVTQARIQEVLDVGHMHGVHAYARIFGDYNNVLIFFTPDIDGGV